MIAGRTIAWVVLATVTALAAYTATITSRPTSAPTTAPAEANATEALLTWLEASPQQLDELKAHDPTFPTDLKQLKADLEAKRTEFASALERVNAPEDEVLARLEATLSANAALQRRIAKYLLSVRDHLTPQQRQKLFGLCAEEARHGRQWRGGRGATDSTGAGDQSGRGRRGWRGGRGPSGPGGPGGLGQ